MTKSGFDLDEIERRVSRASPNDRAYERPMNWDEAAALLTEIRELRAENARLREALEPACEVIESCNATFLHKWGTTNKWRNGVLAAARAALGEPQ